MWPWPTGKWFAFHQWIDPSDKAMLPDMTPAQNLSVVFRRSGCSQNVAAAIKAGDTAPRSGRATACRASLGTSRLSRRNSSTISVKQAPISKPGSRN